MSAAARPVIVLVVAVAENGVIGRDNKLPWHLKSDLSHFRALTIGRPVVMGRKTFQSIGKPLPGRTNIVVTRDPDFSVQGIVLARDFDAAIELARADARARGSDSIAVIGGTEIFRQALPLAGRVELTRVHARPDGDTYFPELDARQWRETARRAQPKGPGDDYAMTFMSYQRAGAA